MTLRLFAALEMPDDAAARLLALMKGVPGAKWRPRENLHLTLRFFGEIAEPVADDLDAELQRIADASKPFELELRGAGWFGAADPHALWVGAAASPALLRLAEQCERAARRLGLPGEPHRFAPHVTLAYLTGAPLERVQSFVSRLGLFKLEPFRVDRFGLFSSVVRRSAPSLYRIEAEYSLRK